MNKKKDFNLGISETKNNMAGAFLMAASTATMNRELEDTEDIDTYLKINKKNMIPHNLPMHLEMLLREKQLTKADVVRDSEIDRKYLYQIFSGEKNPSRDKLIALAFGLHLSKKEVQTMLKVSGKGELYPKRERDSIILFALNKKMNIAEVNGLLFDHGFDLLGSSEK